MEESGVQERGDALEEGGDPADSSYCEAHVVLWGGDGQFDVFKATAYVGGYFNIYDHLYCCYLV